MVMRGPAIMMPMILAIGVPAGMAISMLPTPPGPAGSIG